MDSSVEIRNSLSATIPPKTPENRDLPTETKESPQKLSPEVIPSIVGDVVVLKTLVRRLIQSKQEILTPPPVPTELIVRERLWSRETP